MTTTASWILGTALIVSGCGKGASGPNGETCGVERDTYPGEDGFPHDMFQVSPVEIEPAVVEEIDKEHVVTFPRHRAPIARLYVFMTGSVGSPSVNQQLVQMAAFAGFRAISLAYANRPIGPVCDAEPDFEQCEEDFRIETLTGDDVSPVRTISRADSIEGRLVTLLEHLHAEDPTQGWDAFVDGNQPRWSAIVVSGFSQGGAYAGMISRDHQVAASIHFDTLCDGLVDAAGQTLGFDAWCYEPRATPGERSLLFLNSLEGGVDEKVGLASAWGLDEAGPIVDVDAADPPYECTNLLSTARIRPGDPDAHGSLTTDGSIPVDSAGIPLNAPAYLYLFERAAK